MLAQGYGAKALIVVQVDGAVISSPFHFCSRLGTVH